MLDAPDGALRPAGDYEATLAVEGHSVGVAGGMHQHRFPHAGGPLIDGVADDIDPEKAPLAAIPDRAFAEIGPVRHLIERRIGADDARELRRDNVDIHRG